MLLFSSFHFVLVMPILLSFTASSSSADFYTVFTALSNSHWTTGGNRIYLFFRDSILMTMHLVQLLQQMGVLREIICTHYFYLFNPLTGQNELMLHPQMNHNYFFNHFSYVSTSGGGQELVQWPCHLNRHFHRSHVYAFMAEAGVPHWEPMYDGILERTLPAYPNSVWGGGGWRRSARQSRFLHHF